MVPFILALFFLSPAILAAPSRSVALWRLPSLSSSSLFSTTSLGRASLKSFSLSTTSRAGLTLDNCTSSSPCAGGRTCTVRGDPSAKECTPGETNTCVCFPKMFMFQDCLDSSECPSGEVCANTQISPKFICASADVEAEDDSVVEVTPLPEPSGPLTMDRCADDSQCAGERSCADLGAKGFEECQDREQCFCAPSRFRLCFHGPDCEDGEVCAEASFRAPLCVSADAEQSLVAIQAVNVPEDTKGFTFDPCDTNADCQEPRQCLDFASPDGVGPCRGSDGSCACVSSNSNLLCSPETPCDEGEVCSLTTFDKSPICVSKDFAEAFSKVISLEPESDGSPTQTPPPSAAPPTDNPTESDPPAPATPSASADGGDVLPATPTPSTDDDDSATPVPTPSPSPTPTPVCVDARALAHLPSSDLVYSRHAVATVLCDSSGSCATGEHMVVWRGKAMMMRSYCTAVGCSRRVMEVNSPRYARRRRVASRTDGLEYTAFAARYGSRAEEAVIAAAVRVGL